jgi:hypothetical protein
LLVGRLLGRRPLQQHRQRRGVRQLTAAEHAVASGPDPVMSHGVAPDAEVAGDAPVGLAQVQPSQDLADVDHWTPPSRHWSPPGAAVLRRGFPVVGSTTKESGHAPPGGSTWPPLGGSVWVTLPGSVWVTLPGSVWATPSGSASPTPVAQYGVTPDTSRPHARRQASVTSRPRSGRATSAGTGRSTSRAACRPGRTSGGM